MSEWQPIKTCPRSSVPVLIAVAHLRWVGEAVYYEDDHGWWEANTHPTDAHDGQIHNPTHWQPLPEPPQ
jgi:hypothetical protein